MTRLDSDSEETSSSESDSSRRTLSVTFTCDKCGTQPWSCLKLVSSLLAQLQPRAFPIVPAQSRSAYHHSQFLTEAQQRCIAPFVAASLCTAVQAIFN